MSEGLRRRVAALEALGPPEGALEAMFDVVHQRLTTEELAFFALDTRFEGLTRAQAALVPPRCIPAALEARMVAVCLESARGLMRVWLSKRREACIEF